MKCLSTSIALSCLALVAPAADRMLWDFESPALPALTTNDAAVSLTRSAQGQALRLVTGTNQTWPGVTLRAPGGALDLSAFGEVIVSVRNAGKQRATLNARVDNPGADGTRHCVSGSQSLEPGQSGTLRMELRRAASDRLGGQLFGMRGYPVSAGGPGTVNASNITQVLLFTAKPAGQHVFEIEGIRAAGTHTPPTAWTSDASPYFPFIDAFGQYRHKSWPGKVASLEDMKARIAAEAREIEAQPGPADWNQYGGWAKGPQLEATGFFRTQKHQGKWWLVDPEGRLFFSHGVDCVRMLDTTPVEEREAWFEDFPGAAPEFQEFFSRAFALKGHYANRSPRCFSFAGANLLRKYGPDWKTEYPKVIHRRLRSWGLNTIANWSDERTRLMRLTPYTDNLSSRGTRMIEGSEGYWGKFPDVFDPSFERSVRRAMEGHRGKSANDPWCIGYFSDNEMSWGDDVSLSLAALKSPADQAAKFEFIRDLRTKYADIAQLNTAWGAAYTSWDDLRDGRATPDKARASADLKAFYSRAAEQYFRVVKEAIKAVAPHQLYLGCRFAWANDRAVAAAVKHCDVVSYNLYHRSVADFKVPGGADVPLIIGEFHFGALDRGMFHTGLVPVANQAARAQAYLDYVLGALKHPQFVGTHWFQYKDEPTTGRVYDEENYQIGFVDVADTPYQETIQAVRKVGYNLYR